MEQLKFVLAKKEYLDEVFAMFSSAIDEMKRNGIEQWDDLYPDREILEEDILNGQLFIGLYHNVIASVYVLNQECDREYENGKWNYPDATYYVVHRLCVNPMFQNKGIGTLTLLHIEDVIREMGIETIRLDAFTLNPYALKIYDKLGYNIVGSADWRKGKFFLMEKNVCQNPII